MDRFFWLCAVALSSIIAMLGHEGLLAAQDNGPATSLGIWIVIGLVVGFLSDVDQLHGLDKRMLCLAGWGIAFLPGLFLTYEAIEWGRFPPVANYVPIWVVKGALFSTAAGGVMAMVLFYLGAGLRVWWGILKAGYRAWQQ